MSNSNTTWTDQATDFLYHYCERHQEFTAEEVRKASTLSIPPPKDVRAWGIVFTRAMQDGHIEKVGYTQSTSKKAKGRMVPLWWSNKFPLTFRDRVINFFKNLW